MVGNALGETQQGYEGRRFGKAMANDVRRAMASLKHRDVRTRRRAVRTLFEHGDESVLEAFELLLDDEDPWFVSKALDAYRMWSSSAGPSSVGTLLSHASLDVRRAGANLLEGLGQEGKSLGIRALDDTDSVVQKQAARALSLLDDDEVNNVLVAHPSPSVRKLAVQATNISPEQVLSLMNDDVETVRNAALEAALVRNLDLNIEDIKPHLAGHLHTVPLLIWFANHAPQELADAVTNLTEHHIKDVTDHLRRNISSSNDAFIQALLQARCLEPVARWVLKQGKEEDELRWSLIANNHLSIIERSKLLERLIGRAGEADVQRRTAEFMDHTTEELLKVACENLSTAATEV